MEPFYVGIGRTKKRAFDMRGRSSWHKSIVNIHGIQIEIIDEVPTWEIAQWWEKRWIKTLKNIGYNIANMTPGGDGGPTWTGRKHSEETKKRMSISAKGNKANLGKIFSEEHKKKLSLSQIGNKKSLGRKDSDETRAKKSNAMKGKKYSLGRKRTLEELKKASEAMKKVHLNKTPEERSLIVKNGHKKRKINKLLSMQYWGA